MGSAQVLVLYVLSLNLVNNKWTGRAVSMFCFASDVRCFIVAMTQHV